MFKGKFYSESELTLKVTIDRENSEVSQVPIKGAHIVFLQHSTLTRHLNLVDHRLVILANSQSLREHGSMREKKHTTKYDDAIELC